MPKPHIHFKLKINVCFWETKRIYYFASGMSKTKHLKISYRDLNTFLTSARKSIPQHHTPTNTYTDALETNTFLFWSLSDAQMKAFCLCCCLKILQGDQKKKKKADQIVEYREGSLVHFAWSEKCHGEMLGTVSSSTTCWWPMVKKKVVHRDSFFCSNWPPKHQFAGIIILYFK